MKNFKALDLNVLFDAMELNTLTLGINKGSPGKRCLWRKKENMQTHLENSDNSSGLRHLFIGAGHAAG